MDTRDLLCALDELGTPRVLIVGDLILDRYLTGDVARISPEAPIPVLAARHDEARLGGAGNVAAGAQVGQTGIECSSCHDPHNGVQVLDEFFLRGTLTGNDTNYICLKCHVK